MLPSAHALMLMTNDAEQKKFTKSIHTSASALPCRRPHMPTYECMYICVCSGPSGALHFAGIFAFMCELAFEDITLALTSICCQHLVNICAQNANIPLFYIHVHMYVCMYVFFNIILCVNMCVSMCTLTYLPCN